ncbi:isoprenylcysteine carboxylmethyltransferase family protein [Pseudomonas sp. H3(2019)]|uniref:methyltransferase family protein n=1 Tax=Pseudomonas sp. H3(2019) TaxID=2598724 RepID=UPI0011929127|nr:isoprenylcysteine carboxylmethyltransferase family protein [Pseudomonas sp. H3(2019)]TVT81947.1 isoprenylcysteine carboxylmethyltransferase family protein [Pseudomonas sp. H3(2019)]
MNDFSMHYGHWGWVLIMVLIASWVLYRFVSPRSWHDWMGAGLVQAFIIALYAEMYGFPLTIYLLTGFLGIDLPLTGFSGHLWATMLGYGAIGAMLEMMLGGVFIVVGLALLIRGWVQVYRTSLEGKLATQGVYGVVRHPQYTGIMLAVFGQVIHWPTVITLLLFPIIVWAYVRLAKREESVLAERFGEEYQTYRQRVPMLFPRLRNWREFIQSLLFAYPE